MTDPGNPDWKPIQHYFGLTAFGINAYVARAAGDRLVDEHDESSGQEEVYLVTAGEARFELGDDEVLASQGMIVAVWDHAVRRAATAVASGTTLVAVGSAPGAFSSSWRTEHTEGVSRHPSVGP